MARHWAVKLAWLSLVASQQTDTCDDAAFLQARGHSQRKSKVQMTYTKKYNASFEKEIFAKYGAPPSKPSIPGHLHAKVNEAYPCKIAFCEGLNQTSCTSQKAHEHGCAWCAGICQQVASSQAWFVDKLREEWALLDPDKINGKTLPAPTKAADSSAIFDGVDPLGTGNVWAEYEDHRPYPYRVPIHIHMEEGLTCITGGKITMYMEGVDPEEYSPGECYVMPANTKMANSPIDEKDGYTDTDTFKLDSGCLPTWVVVEPDAYWVQDTQFTNNADTCENDTAAMEE